MSYILDALRKAEQDRKRGDIPGIEDLQEVRSPEKKPFNQWGWVALAVLNVLLLALLFWPESEEVVTTAAIAEGQQSIAQEQRSVPVQRKNIPDKSMTASIAKPEAEDSQVLIADNIDKSDESIVYPKKAEETEWAEIDDRTLQPIPPPPKVSERKVPRQDVVKKPTTTKESSGNVTFLKDQEMMPAAETETKTKPSVATQLPSEQPGLDLPVWPQVPSGLFSQLQGNLRMDVHVHAEKPEDRFVLINLTKYHEGEDMREGPYVEEITGQGVILDFSGERFFLPAN